MRIRVTTDGARTPENPVGLRAIDTGSGGELPGFRGIRFTGYTAIGTAPLVDISLVVDDIDIEVDVTGSQVIASPSGDSYRLVLDRKGSGNE